MGLLSLGTPLSWDEALPFIPHVKTHGIAQFLSVWDRVKTRRRDVLIWGDEVRVSSPCALANWSNDDVAPNISEWKSSHRDRSSTWFLNWMRRPSLSPSLSRPNLFSRTFLLPLLPLEKPESGIQSMGGSCSRVLLWVPTALGS